MKLLILYLPFFLSCMRNLFNFLIQYSVLILFLILEVTSIFLVVSNQGYQKSVFLSSSNTVVSGMYQVSNSVVEFFKLSAANDNLSEENTALKNFSEDEKQQLNDLLMRVYENMIANEKEEI